MGLTPSQHLMYVSAPAAALAYLDPLSGFVPYSQPIAAAIGADIWFVSQQKNEPGYYFSKYLFPQSMAGAAIGTLLGGYLLPNMDHRLSGALGAGAGAFAGGYFTYGKDWFGKERL